MRVILYFSTWHSRCIEFSARTRESTSKINDKNNENKLTIKYYDKFQGEVYHNNVVSVSIFLTYFAPPQEVNKQKLLFSDEYFWE